MAVAGAPSFSAMKILCTHGWLMSNLGDQWMTDIVLKVLVARGHSVAVSSRGYPNGWACEGVERLQVCTESLDVAARRHLFSEYDKIVNLPGGGLQGKDHRSVAILKDIEICSSLGIPYALAGHSIYSQIPAATLRKVSLILAREPCTAAWLRSQQVDHLETVDAAWSQEIGASTRSERTVIMLRWDGEFTSGNVSLSGSDLKIGSHTFGPFHSIIVSTSDSIRDEALGVKLARQLSASWEPCRTIDELKMIISGAAHLITDRYHPAIVAKVTGTPLSFIGSRSVRNQGLRELMGKSIEELRDSSCAGLSALGAWSSK